MTYVTVLCAHCKKSIQKELRYYNYNFVKRGKKMFCDVVCAGRASQKNGRTPEQREMARMYFKEWHRKQKLNKVVTVVSKMVDSLELPKGGVV